MKHVHCAYVITFILFMDWMVSGSNVRSNIGKAHSDIGYELEHMNFLKSNNLKYVVLLYVGISRYFLKSALVDSHFQLQISFKLENYILFWTEGFQYISKRCFSILIGLLALSSVRYTGCTTFKQKSIDVGLLTVVRN